MSPKPIGLLGGAGPLAGAALLESLLILATSLYGCTKDADFPKIILLSFPFSDMLSSEIDCDRLQQELQDALQELRQAGSEVIAIACNTLHAFLSEADDRADLVHLPRALKEEIPDGEVPLILCTSTSLRFAVHQKYYPCRYPDSSRQKRVDVLIDEILKGRDMTSELAALLAEQKESCIILGCTELSLYRKKLHAAGKQLIDPLEIVSKKLLKISFGEVK